MPIGTEVISLPIYKKIRAAEIVAVDYSEKMLDAAKIHAQNLNLQNVKFIQGDVKNLPFAENSFEVLSSNNLYL